MDIRRKKNSDSARRSRQRKMERMNELEQNFVTMTLSMRSMEAELAQLRKEKEQWKADMIKYSAKIRELEASN
jgi:uncharacterized coiled-coil DUF342 family protein